jgi:hypothetical protein
MIGHWEGRSNIDGGSHAFSIAISLRRPGFFSISVCRPCLFGCFGSVRPIAVSAAILSSQVGSESFQFCPPDGTIERTCSGIFDGRCPPGTESPRPEEREPVRSRIPRETEICWRFECEIASQIRVLSAKSTKPTIYYVECFRKSSLDQKLFADPFNYPDIGPTNADFNTRITANVTLPI